MDRLALLEEMLEHLALGTAEEGRARCLAVAEADPSAYAIAALAAFWLGDFALGTQYADTARDRASEDADAETRALALAAAALTAAGDLDAPATDWPALRQALARGEPGDRWWSAVRYVAAEAALVSARIDEAAEIDRLGPSSGLAWAGHPFATIMWVCEVRIAAFAGQIERAEAMLPQIRASLVPRNRLEGVVDSVVALVRGNAGDAEGARLADAVTRHIPDQPRDFLDRGALLLLAYGAIASYDVTASAALIHRAGGDEALTRCTLIDRALALEILLHAAIDETDEEAMAAWWGVLTELAEHPITAPSVLRARARLALAAGDAETAIRLLTASIERLDAEHRGIESAESKVMLARARLLAHDLGGASRELRRLVAASERTGFDAVRPIASATLAGSGRRLPPVAGAGWTALSPREAEVARAVLAGQEVDEIAATLFLSPRTVRTHLSRVLCAFGVATRVGLLAAVGPDGAVAQATGPSYPLSPLSPRQGEVVALVAAGRTNQQIAAELGISLKGVEKHVGDVLRRWDAASRFELARMWWARAGRAS